MAHATTPLPLSAWCGFDGAPPFALLGADEVVVAATLGAVLPALARVEAAVRAGATAVGFLAYEAAPAFEPAAAVFAQGGVERGDLPLLHFALVHPGGRGRVVEAPWEAALAAATAGAAPPSCAVAGDWAASVSVDAYDAAIGAVKVAIREGDTYQVNYTLRLGATVAGDSRALLTALLRAQRCGYGSFIDTGAHTVLSASPELFFRWEEASGALMTRPMKGTAPRGCSAAQDEAARAGLAACPKNRAENLMIVDLLRNDVGRIAARGSVSVPALFAVEAYPTVLQLTSTVSGVVKRGLGLADVLAALFPCGSITGAPKLSTMRLIASLETAPRGVYCGAILAITPQPAAAAAGAEAPGGGAHTLRVTASVPIRTVVVESASGRAEYGVGGGITWDSTPGGEYAEVLDKAAVLRLASAPPSGGGGSSAVGGGAWAGSAPASLGDAMRGHPFHLLETLRLECTGPPIRHEATSGDSHEPPAADGAPCCDGAPAPAGARYALLPQHLARLAASARFFGYRFDALAVGAALAAHAAAHAPPPSGASPRSVTSSPDAGAGGGDGAAVAGVVRRVRLLLARDGALSLQSAPLDGEQAWGAPGGLAPHMRCAVAAAMRGVPVPPPSLGSLAASAPAPAAPPLQRCVVSPHPVSHRNVFLCHKTSERGVYDAHRRAVSEGLARAGDTGAWLDVLLWSRVGEEEEEAGGSGGGPARGARGRACASEFTIGNLVVEQPSPTESGSCGGGGGQELLLLTPPADDVGCLPGALRAALLEARAVAPAPLPLRQLRAWAASAAAAGRPPPRAWLVNSVRGWLPVELDFKLVDDSGL